MISRVVRQLCERYVSWVEPGHAADKRRLEYVKQWVVPRDLGAGDPRSYLPTDLLGFGGYDIHEREQLARLDHWREAYGPTFAALRADPGINTQHLGQGFLHNGGYPTPDAEVYAAMILDYQPAHIVEVGAGYSTRIARRVSSQLERPSKITVVDPAPRADVTAAADRVILRCVEDVAPLTLGVDARTLLFIDSSHIVRARGDLPYLFNVLLPQVPRGVRVHVHDIFIPYDYPYAYQERLYTEQYVLQALLGDTTRYRVVFATHYLSRCHTKRMQDTFGAIVGVDPRFTGASFWFDVV